MNTTLLNNQFDRIGARLKTKDESNIRTRSSKRLVSLDIGVDRRGEFFEIEHQDNAELQVLNLQPRDRHLLLMIRENDEKNKYLCGHDERHWFVAAIPESASVGTVGQAKEALKPREVQIAQAQKRVAGRSRNRRKNAAYVRQGEWFFLPVRDFKIDDALTLQNEPLVRGNGGKPHWADDCYRIGGETVYVCSHHRNGVTAENYHRIISRNGNAKNWNWRTMRRNPAVYVRGRIRHPDHKTIKLHDWHQVVMNTENQSRAMRNVAFLD
ncbi:hypothetical protein [uncultured Gimesia sp.]|uniref:hypothetical protein n=1 Tax=uncultured Gimesia sp. TaxID=1678688 RepID=UPI00262EF886|nr:hypothetical protein [uncultured Gimesia sp.]